MQLAQAKRDSTIMVAIKKLYTAFTSNNDNDEIRSLLPIRTLEQLEEINQRITDDSGFEAKLVGSCISYLFPWGLSLIT